jgi:hypothetical protein
MKAAEKFRNAEQLCATPLKAKAELDWKRKADGEAS